MPTPPTYPQRSRTQLKQLVASSIPDLPLVLIKPAAIRRVLEEVINSDWNRADDGSAGSGQPGPGTPHALATSLSDAQALRTNVAPDAKAAPGVLYALTADNWNLATGKPVTVTVYVVALSDSEFAPAGYVLDPQGRQQWVSVDVAAGLVDTEAVRDAHIIQFGPVRVNASGQLEVPLLLGPGVPPDALIEELLIPLAGAPTPVTAPPGVEADDTANTLTVTHPYGAAATQVQVNFAGAWLAYTAAPGYNASTGNIDVGNVVRPAGYFTLRTAADAATGRAASASVPSAAFTVAAPAPGTGKPNLLTTTNLAGWVPGDATVTAGKADAGGGTSAVLLAPNANTSNHNLRSDPATTGYATGRPLSFVLEAKAAGTRYLTLAASRADSYAPLGKVLFDLTTGTVVSTLAGTAVAPVTLAGGYYRLQVDFLAESVGFYLVATPSDNTTESAYAGNGTDGVYLANPALQDA